MEALWDYSFIDFHLINIKVYQIIYSLLIIILTKFVLWLIKRYCLRYFSKQNDKGRAFAIIQLCKYILWTMAVGLVLETLGLRLTFLLAGSAALLVGLGIGINQLFNDVVSGVILLFEGTISIGDVVEVDTIVGVVDDINLRTSKITSRDGIAIILPNSKLVSDKVINWSHSKGPVRFKVNVGVKYGTDLELVKQVLETVAAQHIKVLKSPIPVARIVDFGDSSINFEVLFYSLDHFQVEHVKSDLRFGIEKAFQQKEITIPFPQRDLHLYKQ